MAQLIYIKTKPRVKQYTSGERLGGRKSVLGYINKIENDDSVHLSNTNIYLAIRDLPTKQNTCGHQSKQPATNHNSFHYCYQQHINLATLLHTRSLQTKRRLDRSLDWHKGEIILPLSTLDFLTVLKLLFATMVSKFVLSKAPRLFLFPPGHSCTSRAIQAGNTLEKRKWTSISTTRHHHPPPPPPPHHSLHHHSSRFFAHVACSEESTPLSIRRKRHQHITCEETYFAAVVPAIIASSAHNKSVQALKPGKRIATPQVLLLLEPPPIQTRQSEHLDEGSHLHIQQQQQKKKNDAIPIPKAAAAVALGESRVWTPPNILDPSGLPSLEGRGWTFWL